MMNTFYILLPIFLISIGLIECNPSTNTTDAKADPRYATRCYYCTNCPVPFRSSSVYVTDISSNTGWCAKASYDSRPGALATRYAAPPNFCYYRGCEWRGNQFICCCDSYLCNTADGKSYSILALVGATFFLFFQR